MPEPARSPVRLPQVAPVSPTAVAAHPEALTPETALRSIRVERDGPVDRITLDRPGRLNAIDDAMVAELCAHFTRLRDDLSCRIVVLRGAGGAFCAGLDLKARGAATERSAPAGDPEGRGPSLRNLVGLMRACPQPIVALVEGPACGGGFILALASDIRIAAESARMNVAFVKLGLSGCELGTSWFLPRIVGLSVARELMMTGRFIGARRALATGLVSEVTPDAELGAAGEAMVADLLRTSPTGLRRTKETLETALAIDDLHAVMRLEEHTQLLCLQGPDFAEATAAFLEKREPDFAFAS